MKIGISSKWIKSFHTFWGNNTIFQNKLKKLEKKLVHFFKYNCYFVFCSFNVFDLRICENNKCTVYHVKQKINCMFIFLRLDFILKTIIGKEIYNQIKQYAHLKERSNSGNYNDPWDLSTAILYFGAKNVTCIYERSFLKSVKSDVIMMHFLNVKISTTFQF